MTIDMGTDSVDHEREIIYRVKKPGEAWKWVRYDTKAEREERIYEIGRAHV